MTESAFPPRHAVATDIVVFTIRANQLGVLLIQRRIDPFRGRWALPGGFVLADESLEVCAQRELREETGLDGIYLEQLFTFGAPDRDPRGRVLSVAYFALVPSDRLELKAGSDAADTAWFPMTSLPHLAFDHQEILSVARERLVAKLEYSTIGLLFMPDEFTLSDVQSLYEVISGKPRDKRNFRKWFLSLGVIEETGALKADGAHRPAKLYRRTHDKRVQVIR